MLEAAPSDLVPIAVTGEDRVSHLDAVTSQQFAGADPGTVVGVLVLGAKGAPLAMAWALVDEDRILLLAPPEAADHVMDDLATKTFLADVTFTREQPGPITALGGDPGELTALAKPDTWQVVRAGDEPVTVVHHAFGVEVVGTDDPSSLLGGDQPAIVELDDLRIRRGEPRWGHEVVAGRLPEEYGLLATHVHMSKGCYPGQEPIAHMWMLGRPRRRLARLEGSGVGSLGEVDDVEVTGVAGDTALAYLKPDVEVDAEVADGVRVAAFVGDHREVVGWTPGQTRGRDRAAGEDRPGRRP